MLSFSHTSALPSSSFISLTACSVSPYPMYRVETWKRVLKYSRGSRKLWMLRTNLHDFKAICTSFCASLSFRKLYKRLSILFFLSPFTLYTFHPSLCCLNEKVSLHPEYFILHVKNVSFSRHVNDISFHPLVCSIEILIEP